MTMKSNGGLARRRVRGAIAPSKIRLRAPKRDFKGRRWA